VDELLKTHAELGRVYRQALAAEDLTEMGGYQRVDRRVKGIDRPPTKHMDELVREVVDQSKRGVAGASATMGGETTKLHGLVSEFQLDHNGASNCRA